jgi:hypothetical protein
MVRIQQWWRALRNVAIAVSVLFNIIFLFVLIIVVMLLFDVKRTLLNDLVFGLDKSFYGLNEATILANIKVKDDVPVVLNIPYSANTTVRLTAPVPIRANATFNLPGGGGTINGTVNIVLPSGLDLPIALSINVPVNDKLPIDLNVPVQIAIKDTQLTVPIQNLRKTLERYVLILGNLPNSWGDFWPYLANLVSGRVSLLDDNKTRQNPWPDFQIAVVTPSAPGQAVPPPGATGPNNPPVAPPTLDPAALATLGASPSTSGGPAKNPAPITATPGSLPPGPTPTRVEDLGIVK